MVFSSLFSSSPRTSIDEGRPSDGQLNSAPTAGKGQNSLLSNRSMLRDFIASIATMTGDLSNITAPPFVLDAKSVVEIPAFWAENPAMFCSPAEHEESSVRALLILKSFLGGLKSQCYMGHTEEEGVRKPLNAFLGELFLGHWEDEESGRTEMCAEQVSHHPPITACRVWNEKYGVSAEGFNRQKITFSLGSVHIISTGFALKTIEKYNEHYLLPLPDFKVKGVLSGAPYPETSDTWYIPSTNGWMSEIKFSGGKGWFGGGEKHSFIAWIYKEGESKDHAIYTVKGAWNTTFSIRDERAGKDIETFDVRAHREKLPPLQMASVDEMDPWESRKAWHDTIEAINNGDMKGVTTSKGFLEQGQREMRKEEQRSGTKWQPIFYTRNDSHDVVRKLMDKIPDHDFDQIITATEGVWHFNMDAFREAEKPYHPGVQPDNLKQGEQRRYSMYRSDSRSSRNGRSGTPQGSIGSRRSLDGGRPAQVYAGSPDRRSSVDATGNRNSTHSPTAQKSRLSEFSKPPPTPAASDQPNPLENSNTPQTGSSSTNGNLPIGATSANVSQPQHSQSQDANSASQTSGSIDHKLGAVEDGRSVDADGVAIDVGQEPSKPRIANGVPRTQPEPQVEKLRMKEEDLGTGVDELSLNDKIAVEDMLRDQTSSRGKS